MSQEATCIKPQKTEHDCMHFYFAYMSVFMSAYVCVCVPQLYTQLTVILDDPDFPRLTLTVSQLSHSNLSVTHKYTDTVVN